MKILRPYPRLVITKKGTRWTEGGHPWIYEAEVLRTEDASGVTLPLPLENGSLVDVVSESGKYLGTGFLSLQSKIRVRILSRNANDRFDEDFWRRRVRYALDYRKAVMGQEDLPASRVIFGEADGFPGLTVDRFNDLLVSEVLSVGIEQRKGLIYRLLLEEFLRDGVQIRGASSITRIPCLFAIARISAIRAGWPKMCTGRIAFVRGVILAAICSGSML